MENDLNSTKRAAKKKTVGGLFPTPKNMPWKNVRSKKKLYYRDHSDSALYEKLRTRTLTYTAKLARDEKIARILKSCPDIIEEALTQSEQSAYKLFLKHGGRIRTNATKTKAKSQQKILGDKSKKDVTDEVEITYEPKPSTASRPFSEDKATPTD